MQLDVTLGFSFSTCHGCALVKTRSCPDFGLVTVVLWLLARYSVQLDQVPRGFPVVVESLSRWWKSDDVATVAECCRDKALVLIGGVCSKDNSYSNAYLSLSPWSQLPYTWAIYNFGMLLGWMKMCQAMHTSYSVFHPLQVDSGCGCTRMLQNPSAQSSSNSQLSAQNNEVALNPLLDVES
jgi:hypothetical protein